MGTMFNLISESFSTLMIRGGWVMWPLLAMSLVAVTLLVERSWFWWRTNSAARLRMVARVARLLRQGDAAAARTLVGRDDSVYAQMVHLLLDEKPSEAVATEAIEVQRPRLERFMPTLSTIITAAPMLGILGTVTGIIASFAVLSDHQMGNDPRLVGQGIGEALLTTAAGLIVAIVVLLPYNAFRAQLDRTLGRMGILVAAAMHGTASPKPDSRAADGAADKQRS